MGKIRLVGDMVDVIDTLVVYDDIQYKFVERVGESWLLVGGKYPLTGPRSNYCAEMRAVDSISGETNWTYRIDRSYPFSKAVQVGKLAIGLIDQNFPGSPTGLWLVDVETGSLVRNIKVDRILDFASTPEQAFVISAAAEFDCVTVSSIHPDVCDIGTFPTTATEKLCSISASEDLLVLGFELDNKRKVSYRYECRSRNNLTLKWTVMSTKDSISVHEDFVSCFCYAEPCKSIEVYCINSGQLLKQIQVSRNTISRIRRFPNGIFAWVSDSGEVAFDTEGDMEFIAKFAFSVPGWLDFDLNSDRKLLGFTYAENDLGLKTYFGISTNHPKSAGLFG